MFAVQVVGSLVIAIGLVLSGVTSALTLAGSVLVLLSIAGLAARAFALESRDADLVDESGHDGRSGRSFGHGSK